MSQKLEIENNAIVRFLLNDASERDILQLEERIETDAEFKEHFEQIRDTWQRIELEKELDDMKIRRDLNKFMERTSQEKEKTSHLFFANRYRFLKAAAVFIIGFFFSWYLFNKDSVTTNHSSVYNTIETPKGSNSVIALPDGSKITLNAQSKLRYPEKFSKNSREVYLEGEAFFEIAGDSKRQFLVKTPEIVVKVFGTSFNIKNYPDENFVETTLVEGSISLYETNEQGEATGKEIKMEPDQQVILYKAKEIESSSTSKNQVIDEVPKPMKPKLMLAKKIDTKRFISWKDGELIIKSEPLEKLAFTLERRFDVIIHFEEEKIKEYRFTGIIKDETIEQVMAAIKLASSIDYRFEDREIRIMSKETQTGK
jgi:transmembrane sensor